ncbi:unnamed protein product [Cylindrotheca closterium]|uniref:HSF-type DNA-binding domain-containing protein n=1 Tax=Cylindrotheca closterium TaxID=2856 RepID=A0AAD2FN10_9STRA|nr:unnamed protein product [Cylindrotheca closterium]
MSSNTTLKQQQARKKEMNFAESVHQLVTEVSERDPTMMQWTSDGAAFIVNPSHPELGVTLGKYFQHSKYSSFQRQLNQYGWTKPRSGRYTGTFFNPFFRKDTELEEVRKIGRGGCKKHLRTVGSSSENTTPFTRKKSRYMASSSRSQLGLLTPSPHRRRSRLPLQKRPVNIPGAKAVSPLTPKSIENPSADDITAVQVLLGMVQKTAVPEELRPSDCSIASSSEITQSRRSKSSRNFALAVHALVTETHANNPKIIKWVEGGTAFEVDASHPKLGDALGKYFQHSKYSSFQRQLNQYGWCKLRNTGKFFNHHFHQDKEKSNFDLIRRKDKDKKADASLVSKTRVSKRASVASGPSGSDSKRIQYISVPSTKRRRMSSISEPNLQPVSDEDTISSSEEGSILSRPMSFVDLTRPPSNVTAYLPQQSNSHLQH